MISLLLHKPSAMKTQLINLLGKNSWILILLVMMLFSCKKEDTQEKVESYPPYIHLNFHNHKDSEHFIYLIETRIYERMGGGEDEEWSDNIIQPGQHISPNDSASFYLQMDRGAYCDFRFGVITNLGEVIKIYEQEGWYTPLPPYFQRQEDHADFYVKAYSANNGIIYISDWQ